MGNRKGVFKRTAQVPVMARRLPVSKADLLEVAWSLAAIAHEGGCDDAESTLARLLEELNLYREQRGMRRLTNDRFDDKPLAYVRMSDKLIELLKAAA